MPNNEANQAAAGVEREYFWSSYGDMVLILALAVITGVFIFILPLPLMRLIFGLPFVFFAPGYALLAALYGNNDWLSHEERFWASFGLSVVATSLLGLIVGFAIGNDLRLAYSVLLIWVAGLTAIAVVRRQKMKSPASLPGYALLNLGLLTKLKPQSRWQFAELIVFLLVVLAVGRLLWVSSQAEPRFTEFYLLGEDGAMGNYPENIGIDDPVSLIVGVISHEKGTTPYALYYNVNGGEDILVEQFELNRAERRESEVALSLPEEAGQYKITFSLHMNDDPKPYHTNYVWLTRGNEGTIVEQDQG